MDRTQSVGDPATYASSLLGRVNRALYFETGDAALANGRAFLLRELKRFEGEAKS